MFESFQYDRTVLHIVCVCDSVTVVSLLLKEAADVNIEIAVSKILDFDHVTHTSM